MIEYYIRTIGGDAPTTEDFWALDDGKAHQNITPSEIGTHHADPGQDILTTIRSRFPESIFHRLELGPGEYYPRMARPTSVRRECSPGRNPETNDSSRSIRTTSTGQLHALIQILQKICQVVHPTQQNFCAFGHEIRNVTILACTEVEAHLKNILVANGQTPRNRLDYVKLSAPMKLGEYRVLLPWYPWIDAIAPFENWVETPPGELQCLPWYDAYNAIKHDRERNFAEAKLIHALTSVAGCFVLLCAQYGWDFARSPGTEGDAFFHLIQVPEWSPSDIYVPPFGAAPLAKNYPFQRFPRQ